jgi:hypothetical protein
MAHNRLWNRRKQLAPGRNSAVTDNANWAALGR